MKKNEPSRRYDSETSTLRVILEGMRLVMDFIKYSKPKIYRISAEENGINLRFFIGFWIVSIPRSVHVQSF